LPLEALYKLQTWLFQIWLLDVAFLLSGRDCSLDVAVLQTWLLAVLQWLFSRSGCPPRGCSPDVAVLQTCCSLDVAVLQTWLLAVLQWLFSRVAALHVAVLQT
jgi:hypothetical protein